MYNRKESRGSHLAKYILKISGQPISLEKAVSKLRITEEFGCSHCLGLLGRHTTIFFLIQFHDHLGIFFFYIIHTGP